MNMYRKIFLLCFCAFNPNEVLWGTIHNYWNLKRISKGVHTYRWFFLKYARRCAFVWNRPHLQPWWRRWSGFGTEFPWSSPRCLVPTFFVLSTWSQSSTIHLKCYWLRAYADVMCVPRLRKHLIQIRHFWGPSIMNSGASLLHCEISGVGSGYGEHFAISWDLLERYARRFSCRAPANR